MFSRQGSYTQVLLKRVRGNGDKEDYVTYWIPSSFVGRKVLIIQGEDYKVIESYASYSKEHVEKYPKIFKTAIPQIGT